MKTYSLREKAPDDVQETLQMYPELLRDLLFSRGITTTEAAERFLRPDYVAHLHDPFLIKDMDKSVSRIIEAIKNNEKVVIFSDYDADGIPGAVVLHDFFKKIGFSNFSNYIPHRHHEGFGLNSKAIDLFIKDDVKLLITIDCGIADNEEVAMAAEAGIDVIITDHHLPHGDLPPAYAILNSKQNDCEYPHKMLCGAAVVFKLVQALIEKGNFAIKTGQEKWFLDMVGIATLSDMVPLTDENRVLAYYGLKVLQKSPRPGLMKLLSKLNIPQKYLSEDDIGFMISPRINAASRMGVPHDAFRLLSTTDDVEAGNLAAHLENINQERKGIVAAMVKEMKRKVDERGVKAVIVMGNPEWRPSLLGLAANSLVEAYNRPVFLWGREGGELVKGSCRSNGAVSVVALMEKAKDTLQDFGGHDMSGGFSLTAEQVHTLETKLIAAAEELMAEPVDKIIQIDRQLTLEDVSPENWRQLEKLAPFGIENPKPLFIFKSITPENVKPFGKTGDHLELTFRARTGKIVRAIGFFMKPEQFLKVPKTNESHDLVATIEKSMFRNRAEIRLRIVDII